MDSGVYNERLKLGVRLLVLFCAIYYLKFLTSIILILVTLVLPIFNTWEILKSSITINEYKLRVNSVMTYWIIYACVQTCESFISIVTSPVNVVPFYIEIKLFIFICLNYQILDTETGGNIPGYQYVYFTWIDPILIKYANEATYYSRVTGTVINTLKSGSDMLKDGLNSILTSGRNLVYNKKVQ